jgi:hypothetical protein
MILGKRLSWDMDGIRRIGKMGDKDFFRCSLTERVALISIDRPH